MKSPIKISLFAAALTVLLASPSHAQLVISNSDINSNNYTYELGYDNMNAKLQSDAAATQNIAFTQEPFFGNTEYFYPTAGSSTASIVYDFNFATTTYVPTSVSFTDYFVLFSGTGHGGTTMTSSYSLDGGNSWNVLNSDEVFGATTTSKETNTVSTLGANDVQYMVTWTPGGESDTFVDPSTYQFNRTNSGDPANFVANFSVASTVAAPEPSTWATMFLGLGVLLLAKRGFFRRTV